MSTAFNVILAPRPIIERRRVHVAGSRQTVLSFDRYVRGYVAGVVKRVSGTADVTIALRRDGFAVFTSRLYRGGDEATIYAIASTSPVNELMLFSTADVEVEVTLYEYAPRFTVERPSAVKFDVLGTAECVKIDEVVEISGENAGTVVKVYDAPIKLGAVGTIVYIRQTDLEGQSGWCQEVTRYPPGTRPRYYARTLRVTFRMAAPSVYWHVVDVGVPARTRVEISYCKPTSRGVIVR